MNNLAEKAGKIHIKTFQHRAYVNTNELTLIPGAPKFTQLIINQLELSSPYVPDL